MRGSFIWSAWLVRLPYALVNRSMNRKRFSETIPMIEPLQRTMFLPKIMELETYDKKKRLVKVMFIKQ